MRLFTTAFVLALAAHSLATAATQEHFKTPEAAMRALESALREKKTDRVEAILGPESDAIISSGDAVDDDAARKRFLTAAGQKTRIEKMDDGMMAIVHLGKDDWPFPIPLKRDADGWIFDTPAGKEELLNRRIGRNELTTISACREFVDAENEYYARFGQYAKSFRSTPGQKDGLYWEETDGDESPLGPLVAEASAEGYQQAKAAPDAAPAPYHGYYYKILTAQGSHGPGGAMTYLKDGKMVGGFALIAWPAEHGSSGIMTFMVSREGVVYQKDLGAGTTDLAKAINQFDPDATWDPTR
jgi:hypothetical protein